MAVFLVCGGRREVVRHFCRGLHHPPCGSEVDPSLRLTPMAHYSALLQGQMLELGETPALRASPGRHLVSASRRRAE
jgi:hypothetical protein